MYLKLTNVILFGYGDEKLYVYFDRSLVSLYNAPIVTEYVTGIPHDNWNCDICKIIIEIMEKSQ